MRFVLQNYETEKYFRAVDDWTEDWRSAKQFPTPGRAIEVAQELGGDKIHMMILGEDGTIMLGTRVFIPGGQNLTTEAYGILERGKQAGG